LPGGVYTTLRTYDQDYLLPLEDHIRRLEESAALVDCPVHLEKAEILVIIRQALQVFRQGMGKADVRIRLSVDLENEPGALYLGLEPLSTPTEQDYQFGVKVVTRRLQRENPRAKQTAFIHTADKVRKAIPADVNEALLVDESGAVLEGLSSNFFAVKQGELWTASEGVLSGITRQLVLDAAHQAELIIHLGSVQIAELAALEEAFITSASRSVLPIRQIDGDRLPASPGPLTQMISRLYWERIRQQLIRI